MTDQGQTARPVRYRGRLRGFLTMPLADKATLAIAWLLLALAALVIRWIPFRRLTPLLGRQIGAVGCIPLVTARQEDRARLVKRAVRRAATLSPWRNDCLPQALVGAALCRAVNVPVTTHLGVRLNGTAPLEAHAWTCSGKVAVTGGQAFVDWMPVSCFAALRR
ncbi:MAG: lasso peptide biosynthesis B2 protein [Sphingomonadales bacterium]|nr:lasso peptide biosynthesis B2 protein [Sphingomonadales bacterium]